VIYYGVSARLRPETPERWAPTQQEQQHEQREASVVEAGSEGWFSGQSGPSTAADESARVVAQLATPSHAATDAGLPIRRSKAHLVPGAFETAPAAKVPGRAAEERLERFRGYRSGLRRTAEDG
jgi:hypothetical protein